MAKTSVTIRLDETEESRLDAQIEKAGCSRLEYVHEALLWALERDERPPTPDAVTRALPHFTNRGVTLPEGIVHRDQW